MAVAKYPLPLLASQLAGAPDLIADAISLVPDDSHDAGQLLARYGSMVYFQRADYEAAQEAYERGFAVDESGNVYVTDSFNGPVQVFDSNVNFLTKWDSLGEDDNQIISPPGPGGIAVAWSGRVYVLDAGNFRILVFHSIPNQ
jgi:DNA-binding beta-propeller fold protein YncE